MAKILFGKPVAEKIRAELKARIREKTHKPTLSILTVGDSPDTAIYLKRKKEFGEEIGVGVSISKFGEDVLHEELEHELLKIIADENINGVIVQLPLPEKIDTEKLVSLIPEKKDADGLSGSSRVIPATARGVFEILKFYEIDYTGKRVTVVGNSRVAGSPIAKEFSRGGAIVLVCDKETPPDELREKCKGAHIVVSATGVPHLIDARFVSKGQIVIDVGIRRLDTGKVVGDVIFDEVEPIVDALSPVPGGVGPLTVASLFQNLLDLC